jgi:hypothetical protein
VDKTVQAREYFSFRLHVGRVAGAGRVTVNTGAQGRSG